ncbi:MAG: hypothetical protein ACXIVQ_00580 [Acidimicrobiales bacterium]
MLDTSPSATARWTEVLDGLESSIPGPGALTTDRSIDPAAPFHPPEGLGPLPVELHERARRVLDGLEAAMGDVVAAQRAIVDELEQLSTPSRRSVGAPDSPAPSLVDHDA